MTEVQLKSLVLIPKFTGGLSMIGSSLVCYDILKERKTKLGKVYHRLLFVMSSMDVVLSFTLFLSTWPIPKDTPGAPWLAAGNDATCTAQGFMQVFFMPALFYNAYLSIYYVMVIVYGWRERNLVKYEMMAHAFSFLFSCVTGFTALAMDLLGSNFLVWCFIKGSWNLQLAMNIVWQWLAWLIVFIMMSFLCWKTWSQYRTTGKYGEAKVRDSILRDQACLPDLQPKRKSSIVREFLSKAMHPSNSSLSFTWRNSKPTGLVRDQSSTTRDRTGRRRSSSGGNSKKNPMVLIRTQAALFSLSYLLTESSNIAVSIAYYTSEPQGNVPVWVLQYALVTVPLQGFWNCLIYFRPRYLKWYEQRQKERAQRRQNLTTVSERHETKTSVAAAGSNGNGATDHSNSCVGFSMDASKKEWILKEDEEEKVEEDETISSCSPFEDVLAPVVKQSLDLYHEEDDLIGVVSSKCFELAEEDPEKQYPVVAMVEEEENEEAAAPTTAAAMLMVEEEEAEKEEGVDPEEQDPVVIITEEEEKEEAAAPTITAAVHNMVEEGADIHEDVDPEEQCPVVAMVEEEEKEEAVAPTTSAAVRIVEEEEAEMEKGNDKAISMKKEKFVAVQEVVAEATTQQNLFMAEQKTPAENDDDPIEQVVVPTQDVIESADAASDYYLI